MIRGILAFVVLYFIFHFGIQAFLSLSGKEKWELAKTMSYATALSIFVFVFLTIIVVVF